MSSSLGTSTTTAVRAMTMTTIPAMLFFLVLLSTAHAQTIHRVRYGYFTEARPPHAACARGWFDLYIPEDDVLYKVECYPQASGNFASSRLDNLQLDIANLGSTPWAQAAARGVDAKVVYIAQYQGDAQGIYVRSDEPDKAYQGVSTPFDLRGRNVGVPFGSTMHYQILFLIELFGLTGSVNVVNMSPTEIISAWGDQKRDPPQIDAAGVWGAAREYVLSEVGGRLPAETLMSARVLSDWGRPTFVVVAATRTFTNAHPKFMKHFVGMLSRLNDSFLDRLGKADPKNVPRWDASLPAGSSLIPSMVDALMKSGETAGSPSTTEMFHQRRVLELFIQQSAAEQNSCDYLGPAPGRCPLPTLQHIATRQTAEFLVNQKILAQLGPLDMLTDSNGKCADPATLCGGDIFDGSDLFGASETCTACLPVGPYADRTSPVSMELDVPDMLLAELERLDNATGRRPYANNEIGRAPEGAASIGDSTCVPSPVILGGNNGEINSGRFGDGANGLEGKSYSDNLACRWVAWSTDCTSTSGSTPCQGLVELQFETLRVWSGDFVRIFQHADTDSCLAGTDGELIAQVTGIYENTTTSLPAFRGRGCLSIVFKTDGNQERLYGGTMGDGFVASFDRDVDGCRSSADCNGNACVKSICECITSWGADCSDTATCQGINTIRLIDSGEAVTLKSSNFVDPVIMRDEAVRSMRPVDPAIAYPNDLDCKFLLVSNNPSSVIRVDVLYDLEPTHDMLWLETGGIGAISEPYIVLTGTHREVTKPETYYLPTDENGIASMHLVTDARGRRRGFIATVQATATQQQAGCEEAGYSGYGCEIPHCSFINSLMPLMNEVAPAYAVGRVVSQSKQFGKVRAMPWSPGGGCVWPLQKDNAPSDIVALRFRFNSPLDLESHPVTAVGDKLVIGDEQESIEYFVENCESDEACSYPWQTGRCGENGTCTVETVIQADYSSTTDVSKLVVSLITDRNDGNSTYTGLDFDIVFVEKCPLEEGDLNHCEVDGNGKCVDGFCICGEGRPCDCRCDGDLPVIKENKINVALVAGIVVPIAVVILIGLFLYRRRKIRRSREQKRIIVEKDAELETIRDSVIGMRSVVKAYIPQDLLNGDTDESTVELEPVEKVTWCWKETEPCIGVHPPANIYGNPLECWIKYDEGSNMKLESNFKKGKQTCELPDYFVDFEQLLQMNKKSGFKREVKRHTDKIETAPRQTKIDLTDVMIGDGQVPEEIVGDPCMVLVVGDIIQISKQRPDGWGFGTKLHHADEALARSFVQQATCGSSEDSNVYTDTGWFPLEETTRIPTSEDLATFVSNVGNTDALSPPSNWDRVLDPTLAQRHNLKPDNQEGRQVVDDFLSTLSRPQFQKRVEVLAVERIQNLAMWQSYVVKRQTVCYREQNSQQGSSQAVSDSAMKHSLERFERKWLWHATNVESIDKILQQGFNRSFCGKNATMFGRGVYFARDAAYSAHPAYAVPDRDGLQYMIACRVLVGEYCLGRSHALTPDIRDHNTNMLFDSTVGVLNGESMSNPSIYVTYHDAQAYPEYLISFRCE